MSKAEELASKEWSDLGFCNNEQSNAFKLGYLKGYHQAEKDLELTWEDVEIILNAFLDFCIENKEQGKTKRYADKEYCQEVLKRLKNMKDGSKR